MPARADVTLHLHTLDYVKRDSNNFSRSSSFFTVFLLPNTCGKITILREKSPSFYAPIAATLTSTMESARASLDQRVAKFDWMSTITHSPDITALFHSNDLPPPLQSVNLKASTNRLEHASREIQAGLDLLWNAVASLEAQMSRVRSLQHDCRIVLFPIRRVPAEIVMEILRHTWTAVDDSEETHVSGFNVSTIAEAHSILGKCADYGETSSVDWLTDAYLLCSGKIGRESDPITAFRIAPNLRHLQLRNMHPEAQIHFPTTNLVSLYDERLFAGFATNSVPEELVIRFNRWDEDNDPGMELLVEELGLHYFLEMVSLRHRNGLLMKIHLHITGHNWSYDLDSDDEVDLEELRDTGLALDFVLDNIE
ncbi:hypothetical protein ARMSODRAFT_1053081 [Armillaria solidipes]|uniref:Uncharacterized protein n=1 Tax=Armillaria solidipes TaxID=1076256 RepID=A0A2H3B2P7_9AGAR|nr:hypothetical protein ARMSODRAFT_1053081 [Armillaria solidipes]